MRKYFIILFVIIFTIITINVYSQINKDGYEKLNFPLFDKVFPGIEFYQKKNQFIEYGIYYDLFVRLNDTLILAPCIFNELLKKVEVQSTASIEEKLTAFIEMQYWTNDKPYNINVEPANLKLEKRPNFNYKITFMVGMQYECYFNFKDGISLNSQYYVICNNHELFPFCIHMY